MPEPFYLPIIVVVSEYVGVASGIWDPFPNENKAYPLEFETQGYLKYTRCWDLYMGV